METPEMQQMGRVRASLLSFCQKNPQIYVYGAGKYAESCLPILREIGIIPQGFIVTENANAESFHGFPVYEAATIREDLNECCGVIAAFSGANELMLRDFIGEAPAIFALPDDVFCALMDTVHVIPFLSEFQKKVKPKPLKPLEQWKRILVIRLDVLGDLIMTTAFLRELRQNCPDTHITLVIHKSNYFLFKECPYLTELLLYDGPVMGGHADAQLNHREEIEERVRSFNKEHWQHCEQYDVVLLPCTLLQGRNALTTFLLAEASPSDCFVGRVNSFRTDERLLYPYLREIFSMISYETEEKHETQYMLDMLRQCGGHIADERIEVWINDDTRKFAQNVVMDAQRAGACFIALGLVGSVPGKNWPIEKYKKLCEDLVCCYERSVRFILLGGEDACKAAGAFLDGLLIDNSYVINLTGKTNLMQAAAVIQRCDLYIGADTGLMHMAVACGIPVVELSIALPDCMVADGAVPIRMGPWGVPYVALQPSSIGHCSGLCRANRPHCITGIAVDDVIAATEELINGKNGR